LTRDKAPGIGKQLHGVGLQLVRHYLAEA